MVVGQVVANQLLINHLSMVGVDKEEIQDNTSTTALSEPKEYLMPFVEREIKSRYQILQFDHASLGEVMEKVGGLPPPLPEFCRGSQDGHRKTHGSQLKLRSSRVLIVGCGGLGCPAAVYLAAAGVGTIGLLDDDVVELNNLHRQVGHSEATVGQPKVSSLSKRCREVNSGTNIEECFAHLTSSNALDIVSKYDVVLDCTDNLATRYLINDACAVCGPKPLISGSALRLEGQMTVYLANRMRTKEEVESNRPLPRENRAPCFRCLFPVPPPATTVQGCSEAGVFGVVPGIVGTMQAAEAIKLIAGVGTVHSGRLLVLDMERNLTRTVVLRDPRPDCPVCGEHANFTPDRILQLNYVLFCGAPDHDKPSSVNMDRLRNRITVQQLDELRRLGRPHVLLDIRPEVEVDLCRLTPCLRFPAPTLLRDTVLSQIQEALNEKLKQSNERPVPIVVLCHRGNKSKVAATQLASALSAFRLRTSNTSLTDAAESMDTDHGFIGTSSMHEPDFTICDVAGGLAAWAAEIDSEFPVY
ncbi:ThiF family protein [Opisthorchis viverrini]|uniref:ThiF family protein n=1 Tax=Opisthorchis viverrini TaxID=6198 RepID=A0A1S8WI45_OPIVI|nr:ThiF family protein [Opisthorchis viverrini]